MANNWEYENIDEPIPYTLAEDPDEPIPFAITPEGIAALQVAEIAPQFEEGVA